MWFLAVIDGISMPSVSTPRHSERNNAVVAVEEAVGSTAAQRYGQHHAPEQPAAATALLCNFARHDGVFQRLVLFIKYRAARKPPRLRGVTARLRVAATGLWVAAARLRVTATGLWVAAARLCGVTARLWVAATGLLGRNRMVVWCNHARGAVSKQYIKKQ
ncbi:MAG: hypothetical protein LBK60_08260 [Verrucomicrobiales bacterium]|jgi:hypothetical protein|nr:hypothetical protein [Verrucomicrobiales bacterium]